MDTLSPESHQRKIVRVLGIAQVLNGIGVAGTVAAGSLLVSSITNDENKFDNISIGSNLFHFYKRNKFRDLAEPKDAIKNLGKKFYRVGQ